MSKNLLAIALVAVGTYLTRYLPVHWQRSLKGFKEINEPLAYSSTAIISALFVTSLVKTPLVLNSLLIDSVSLGFVVLSYKKWKNLGISILTGVAVNYILRSF
jgi:branched-subunit amino acid transport protein